MESKTRISKRMRVMKEVSRLVRTDPSFAETVCPPGGTFIVALHDDLVTTVLGRVHEFDQGEVTVLLRRSSSHYSSAVFDRSPEVADRPATPPSHEVVDVDPAIEWGMLMAYPRGTSDEFAFRIRSVASQFGLELVGATA